MSTFYPQLLVFLQFTLSAGIIFLSDNFFSHTYALSILVMGLCIGIWALNHNKLGNFNIQPKHKEGSYLVTTGIYKLIRHPMYTSVIIMMFSFVISTLTWLSFLLFFILIVVLIMKAKREEIGLEAIHNEYSQYKQNTKYFIPYIL